MLWISSVLGDCPYHWPTTSAASAFSFYSWIMLCLLWQQYFNRQNGKYNRCLCMSTAWWLSHASGRWGMQSSAPKFEEEMDWGSFSQEKYTHHKVDWLAQLAQPVDWLAIRDAGSDPQALYCTSAIVNNYFCLFVVLPWFLFNSIHCVICCKVLSRAQNCAAWHSKSCLMSGGKQKVRNLFNLPWNSFISKFDFTLFQ